MAKIAVLV